MEELGRFYTRNLISDLLVNSISFKCPKNILELGVGEGSLLKAASSRWRDASFYVADIDPMSLNKIKAEFPLIKSFQFDTIKEDIKDKIFLKDETIDIAICNPPYLRVLDGLKYLPLFNRAGLPFPPNLKAITTDSIFLAKNLEILRERGELGIILPDSIVTGREFIELRNSLLANHTLKAVIQLPEKIFKKTEALTHILVIEKGPRNHERVPLFSANKFGQITDEISVEKNNLGQRMDFKYHVWNQKKQLKKKFKTLNDINAEINRGTATHQNCKSFDSMYLHTSSFVHGKSLSLNRDQGNSNYLKASIGDIIVSRVGKIGKVAIIKKGSCVITDCLYRIRVAKEYREQVFSALISPRGQEWFHANAHGVCAKVISKHDMGNFPLLL